MKHTYTLQWFITVLSKQCDMPKRTHHSCDPWSSRVRCMWQNSE